MPPKSNRVKSIMKTIQKRFKIPKGGQEGGEVLINTGVRKGRKNPGNIHLKHKYSLEHRQCPYH